MDENPYEAPQADRVPNSSLTLGRIFVLIVVAAMLAFLFALGYTLALRATAARFP